MWGKISETGKVINKNFIVCVGREYDQCSRFPSYTNDILPNKSRIRAEWWEKGFLQRSASFEWSDMPAPMHMVPVGCRTTDAVGWRSFRGVVSVFVTPCPQVRQVPNVGWPSKNYWGSDHPQWTSSNIEKSIEKRNSEKMQQTSLPPTCRLFGHDFPYVLRQHCVTVQKNIQSYSRLLSQL